MGLRNCVALFLRNSKVYNLRNSKVYKRLDELRSFIKV